MSFQVRNALAHLVVQDAVVLVNVFVEAGVAFREEGSVADLLCGHGVVRDRHLNRRVWAEVVVQRAHGAVDVLAGVLSGALVGDVAEPDHLAEQPRGHLGDAVSEHELVSAEACRRLPALLLGVFLLSAIVLRFALRRFHEAHRARPPFGMCAFSPWR